MSDKYRAQTPTGEAVVVQKNGNYGTKILLVLVTVLFLALAGFIASLFLPRWWSHYVGGITQSKMHLGLGFGLVCGIVFTFIPLLLLRRVFGLHGSVGGRVAALVLGIVLATPNLTTAAIMFFDTNATHAGQRTFDVDAPWFVSGTAIGAVIGALLAIFWWYGMVARRVRKKRRQEKELEVEQLKIDKRHAAEALEKKEAEAKAALEQAAAEREAAQKLQAQKEEAVNVLEAEPPTEPRA